MRTTLPIDDDVLDRARLLAVKLNRSFRAVINEALREGLDLVEEPAKRRPYKTKPHRMGLLPGRDIDNIQELLAHAEGEAFR